MQKKLQNLCSLEFWKGQYPTHVNVEVKCTLVQALRLCTGCTAHRGSRGIALLCHDHGTRRWWGVYVTPRPLFTPGKNPVPLVQKAGWAPAPVCTGAEASPSPGFDPRTVQPVASRYTDWAILAPPHTSCIIRFQNVCCFRLNYVLERESSDGSWKLK